MMVQSGRSYPLGLTDQRRHSFHRVHRHEPRRYHCTHRRAGGTERRDGTQPANEDHVQYEVQHGHGDAEDHGRARIPSGAQRATKHKENEHAAAEEEHDAQERQCFCLYFGCGVD